MPLYLFDVSRKSVKGPAKWRVLILLALVLICACQSHSGLALEATGALKTKEDYINEILSQLKIMYYTDRLIRGKTFEVIIKDFSLDDEETYAIVEEFDDFWLISLPAERKKLFGTDGISVWKALSVQNVEKDVVETTRKKSIARKFTVPKSISP